MDVPNPYNASSIEINSRGDKLLVLHNKGVSIWELRTGKKLHFLSFKDNISTAFLTPDDNKLLITWYNDNYKGTLQEWDVSTSKAIKKKSAYSVEGGPISSVAFSSDGKLMAVNSNEAINVWDLASRKKTVSFPADNYAKCLRFSPDNKKLFASNGKVALRCWDLETKAIELDINYKLPASTLAFNKDGKYLAIGFDNVSTKEPGNIKVWDLTTKEELWDSKINARKKDEIVPIAATNSGGNNGTNNEKKKTATIRLEEVPKGIVLRANTVSEISDLEAQSKAAMTAGNFPKAIELFTKLIEKQPNNTEAHFGLALGYQDSGKPQEAIQYYQKTLQLDPTNLNAQNNIGMIYLLQLEEYEEAIDIFTVVAEKKPTGEKQKALGNIAECYLELNDKENTKVYYEKALADDPGFAHGNHRFAFFYYNEGNYSEATNYWRKAIAADPYEGLYYKNLGATYEQKLNQYTDAEKTFQDGVNIVPEDRDGELRRAFAEYFYFTKEDYYNAQKYYINPLC